LERQQAFKLFTEGQHFKARVGGTVYPDVFITALKDGTASAPTATVVLPTRIGEPDRIRTWRMDEVEVLA